MLVIPPHIAYTITVVIKKDNYRCIVFLYGPLREPRREEPMDTSQTVEATITQTSERLPYTLWQLVRYFLKLGTFGFGGPVALVGYMRRDLVESRKWISETDYREGLALAQLSPGPLAAQLAMYLGYVRYRRLGATAVGVAF